LEIEGYDYLCDITSERIGEVEGAFDLIIGNEQMWQYMTTGKKENGATAEETTDPDPGTSRG
jgi:hypothetical protein